MAIPGPDVSFEGEGSILPSSEGVTADARTLEASST